MKGKIKWYDSRKGYGFIESEDGKDTFLHRSAISEDTGYLNEGDQVEFDIEETDRGLSARNVKKV